MSWQTESDRSTLFSTGREAGPMKVRQKVSHRRAAGQGLFQIMAEYENDENDGRIGWNHPYIQMTKTAPGYLMQEFWGYSDSYWKKWLRQNQHLIERHNKQPFVRLYLLEAAPPNEDSDDEETNSGGGG